MRSGRARRSRGEGRRADANETRIARPPRRWREKGFALGTEGLSLPPRDLRAELEHGCCFLGGKIGIFHGMPFGNDQRVPFAERTDGQESDGQGILPRPRCRRTASDDLAEDARSGLRRFFKRGHVEELADDFGRLPSWEFDFLSRERLYRKRSANQAAMGGRRKGHLEAAATGGLTGDRTSTTRVGRQRPAMFRRPPVVP